MSQNLLKKLNDITTQMGALGKSGKNPKFSYSYVKGEDAMKIFRQLEVEHKIKVIPEAIPDSLVVQEKPGDKGFVTTFVVKYHIFDLESEEQLSVTLPVQGYDTTDKGVYKALTGGFKYFLLQTFSYSSDDPEEEKNIGAAIESNKTLNGSRFTPKTSTAFKPTQAPATFGGNGKDKSTPVEAAPAPAPTPTPEPEKVTVQEVAPVATPQVASEPPKTTFKGSSKFSQFYKENQ